ncbi:MAG TPA: deoxyribonuclease IV [Candidatus Ozemobacteraceae bacterium]|nr:deoxyribonuclease IV [Candidatus Ozemobacteraceae bacterium]
MNRKAELKKATRTTAVVAWPNDLKIGFHVSVAGGPKALFERYRARACQSLQIFVGSPRVWKRTPLSPEYLLEFQTQREAVGNPPLVVHTGYLINLASARPEVRDGSIHLLREEYQLAKALGADYVVQHMGSHAEHKPGLKLMIDGLNEALGGRALEKPLLLLENTAGERNDLGARLEDIARVRAAVDLPTGVCLDTCHAFQAGYDLVSVDGRQDFFDAWRKHLGVEAVRVVHLNDSLNPFAKGHDRHQHIGEGHIGDTAIAALLQHRLLKGMTVILETPQDPSGDPRLEWKNLRRLAANLGLPDLRIEPSSRKDSAR